MNYIANDLITIFVAPEYFNLCSYLLSEYTNTNKNVRSNKATMIYLLMGGASPFLESCIANLIKILTISLG